MNPQKDNSLAQALPRSRRARPFVVAGLLLLVPALTVLTAFGVAPDTPTEPITQSLVTEAVSLPQWSSAATDDARYVSEERVLHGDTVAALFDRLGVHDAAALDFLRSNDQGRALFRQLVPGRMVQAEYGSDARLLSLRYFMGPTSLLEVKRIGERFEARQRVIKDAPQLVYRTATIQSSLFAASDAAGIPEAVAMQLTKVFATDIDFHTDLRKGDRFSIVYETIYDSGQFVAPGRIVAAQFVNAGHTYEAVLFKDEDGKDAYYSPDGTSRTKSFLRSPVEFTRVSSGFGLRQDPVSHNVREHTGVDLAAPMGTRVLASGDGQVIAAGWRGGYGNAIELRHAGGITTLYGHLSRFAEGIHPGVRVQQGQVIGYVGMTGWATGPHLHYEFRRNGVVEDPMRVALPKADPVPPALRAQFAKVAADARNTIALVSTAQPARFE